MMKNFLFICMLLLGLSTSALAQESIVVTGVVTDTNKEPMIALPSANKRYTTYQ